jgi:hypothetical protein
MSTRATQLANRIIEGAELLATFAEALDTAQWNTVVQPDGRTVGVLVHHIGHLYPIEIDVINLAVASTIITEVTWEGIARLNAEHAREFASVGKDEAIGFLRRNSRAAADAIRVLTDEQLDHAVYFSLSGGAPMTVQFIIEDHPLKHPWHHLARMRVALGVRAEGLARAA